MRGPDATPNPAYLVRLPVSFRSLRAASYPAIELLEERGNPAEFGTTLRNYLASPSLSHPLYTSSTSSGGTPAGIGILKELADAGLIDRARVVPRSLLEDQGHGLVQLFFFHSDLLEGGRGPYPLPQVV
jgi:hypothetical protein